jgi:hypothetical protein
MTGSHGFPQDPALGGEGWSRVTRDELARKAERYSELHGGDDEDQVERQPGMLARVLRRIRGGRD